MPDRLVDRSPRVAPDEIVAALVPPPRFAAVRFDTYRPDPAEPSQPAALAALGAFAARLNGPVGRRRGIFGRGPRPTAGPSGPRPGVYLDGGFGVGKTHLLAALWHATPTPKAYGTFVELTSLVGAIGFAATVAALSGHRLVAVDEFELDDPGDTVLVSTLLTRLVEAGVALAASSNTQPEDLGAGRFAADDFRREIQGLSSRFDTVRIDGVDFRHRGRPPVPPPATDGAVAARSRATAGATEDDFAALIGHLAGLHPSRYGALVADVSLVGLHGVGPVGDQAAALRLVVLADRLYDRSVPIVASGVPLDRVFPSDLLAGPHRKKFQRALSRLGALVRDGTTPVDGVLSVVDDDDAGPAGPGQTAGRNRNAGRNAMPSETSAGAGAERT